MFLVSSRSCLRSIHWSQLLSWKWRCSWSSADRRCSNYIWVINNFIAYRGATYIRGFTLVASYEQDQWCHMTSPRHNRYNQSISTIKKYVQIYKIVLIRKWKPTFVFWNKNYMHWSCSCLWLRKNCTNIFSGVMENELINHKFVNWYPGACSSACFSTSCTFQKVGFFAGLYTLLHVIFVTIILPY